MVSGRLSVLIALSDPEVADGLAAALAEEYGMAAVLPSDLDPPDPVDVVLTDGHAGDPTTPHVGLGPAVDAVNFAARLPASAGTEMIAAALRLTAAGYRILAPDGETDARAADAAPDDLFPAAKYALTPREEQVLALLADGAPNKLIARRLDISVHTAKFHVAALLAKLHARNRTDAIAIAMREGLLLV